MNDYDLHMFNNAYELVDLNVILSDGEWKNYGITKEE